MVRAGKGVGASSSEPTTSWKLPTSSRALQIVDLLRDAIVTGTIPVGARLKQDELCDQFGVSPGPVREALRRLESEGLAQHYPNRGTVVTSVSTEEFLGLLLPVRAAIEEFALPLMVTRMDDYTLTRLEQLVQRMGAAATAESLHEINEIDMEFHELTVVSSGSEHAAQLWRAVAPRVRTQIYRLAPRHAKLTDIVREHRILLDVIKAKNIEELRSAIREHIIGTAIPLLNATSHEEATTQGE